MLSKAERKTAAERAGQWPRYRGLCYLAGKLKIRDPNKAIELLQADASLVEFASPEVAIAALRGELTEEGIDDAVGELTRFFFNNGDYVKLLHNDPKFVARTLDPGQEKQT